ncbi:putative HTH-type transcriptional regulator [Mycobacterium montefiorense]|uniref:HTH-type transcriptional regulator n=2 Tax=Mycobacterium montefiorense TaxID=154654 RepID=A0ABQ0NMB4_9MYCO|nr:putative HTH-type transcriptional regulator [Mycobacterium montefiorense]GKU33814.1 putative HTH-type transcriptional regulator [Mycobacterium montefiorense]GKU42991.1 putative HTH-type transcriptional regulator [Mycobacterium montefiorense]GKU45421.1 putative HTH-type transcriptional regulator [Mycobacterium montefiorense]GKU49286.1 putative HTH-type transcriptional regulator [Mycobacterium montefiorense]
MPTKSDIAPQATPTKRGGTRTKMLVSAAEVMRERGAAGVTIDAVLARSGAPRGSVYYHFPEGRNQILSEALRFSGDSITATIDAAAEHGARALLREFIRLWERLLTDGDFLAGCPVVAAAITADETDQDLTNEAGMILGRWCTALTRAFMNDGFDHDDAASLAVMSISALEGAIVLSRSTRSVRPLSQVGEQLEFLIKAREFVTRNGIPGK